MKYHIFTLLFIVFVGQFLVAQVPKDLAVAITTTVTTSPTPSVKLSFVGPSPADSFVVARREKDNANWFVVAAGLSAASSATLVTDNSVVAQKSYEYLVQQRAFNKTILEYGYAAVSIEAAPVDNRGKIIVLIESGLATSLGAEISTLTTDLVGDGWQPIIKYVSATETVPNVKTMIKNEYTADPTNVKAVFMLGAIPIPYSGDANWDGHPDHAGAWPADAFYADMDGVWTDTQINDVSPSRAANDNIPGDGKYDQYYLPSPVELQIGRVDFRRLTAGLWGTTTTELLRRYLKKDHKWRTKQYTVANKALVDDNFGYFGGEAFASDGFRNAYPLVGAANVVETDFFGNSNPESYLLGYGTGGGTYTSAGGVGSSTDFATDSVNIVFSNLFGSYHGDWDYEADPFMPSALASKGGILTCSWAGRPHNFLHTLGFNEGIGYSMKETMNAGGNVGYFGSLVGESGCHIALLGDPTLRANIIAPPSTAQFNILQNCQTVEIQWGQETGKKYHVYRSFSQNGPFTRLTTNPISEQLYLDQNVPVGMVYYQIRTTELVSSPGGGSYWNTSTGIFISKNVVQAVPPTIVATGGNLDCLIQSVELQVQSNDPTAFYSWDGPNGFASLEQMPSVVDPGVYTLTVLATNGCIVTATATVGEDYSLPNLSAPSAAVLTCSNPTATLTASSTTQAAIFIWLDGTGTTISTSASVTVSQSGTYTVICTGPNGCGTNSTTVVTLNKTAPNVTASASGLLTCSNPTAILTASSTTPNTTFSWNAGQNGPTTQVTLPNNYTVTATGSNGCTSTAQVTVLEDKVAPQIPALPTQTLTCQSPCVLLPAQIPGFPYLICWSGPSIPIPCPGAVNVCVPGNFVATVTNPANGCTTTANLTVNSDGSSPNVSASGGELTCAQTTITLSGNSTTSGATYHWTGPNGFMSNQQNPTVSVSGTYTLTVTAPNGCTASQTAQVSSNTTPPNVSVSSSGMLTCTNLSVTLTASSTTPNTTFSWGGGQNGPTVSVSNSGNYQVVATSLNGCTATSSVAVQQDIALPNLSVSPLVSTICPGQCVEIQINSTTAGTTVAGCGSLPCSIQLCQAGAFSIIATGQNGCTAEQNGQVNQATPPSISIQSSIDCQGFESINAGAIGTLPITFLWSPTNPPFAPLTNWSLVATDGNGCTASQTGQTPAFTPWSVTTSSIPVSDVGPGMATATPVGGVGPFSYLWSNGGTSQTITVNLPGFYTCTVTDSKGCTHETTVEVKLSVSTDEPSVLQKISLAPNPTSGAARLFLSLKKAASVRIEIRSTAGQLITQLPENQWIEGDFELDLSGQPSGVYLINVFLDGQPLTRKLTVIK